MGSSSPKFGVKIKNPFELPPPSDRELPPFFVTDRIVLLVVVSSPQKINRPAMLRIDCWGQEFVNVVWFFVFFFWF